MTQAIESKIDTIVGSDPHLRDALLTLFAHSLAYIRHRKPEWCLVRFSGARLRLFAGRLIVLTLSGREAWVTTDPSAQFELSKLASWRWDEASYPRYKRPPSRNGYYDPDRDTGWDWPAIRAAHFTYLDQVMVNGMAPDSRTAVYHDAAVVEYLSSRARMLLEVPSTGVSIPATPAVDGALSFDPANVVEARERVIASIHARRGQAAFRKAVLQAYSSKCAFSGCAVEEVLDAAHIVPYRGPDTNHVQNGLLLRTDLHTLFDLGLLAVNTEVMTMIVAERLMGTEYARLAGRPMNLPNVPEHQPSKAALDEHRRQSQRSLDPSGFIGG